MYQADFKHFCAIELNDVCCSYLSTSQGPFDSKSCEMRNLLHPIRIEYYVEKRTAGCDELRRSVMRIGEKTTADALDLSTFKPQIPFARF
jgi:hypothetical protein